MLDKVKQILRSEAYWLNDGVHVCFPGGGSAIFLDLKSGRYLTIDPRQTRSVGHLMNIEGWPASDEHSAMPEEEIQANIQALLKSGLIVRGRSNGKQQSVASMQTCQDAMVYRHERKRPKIRFGDVVLFAWSCIWAWFLLHSRSLGRTVLKIERAKHRLGGETSDQDFLQARELIRSFYWIRPFFYGKDAKETRNVGRCLFDSLVMWKFLTRRGFVPAWIIGVKIKPFGAHSWLQSGHIVLNGSPEMVLDFTPVLKT